MLERLALLSVLPKEGDFLTLKLVRQVREDLTFSEAEHEALKFETRDDGGLHWQDGVAPKTFTLGKKTTEMIVQALKAADRGKKLTEDHLSVYEKFVGGDD